MFLTPWGRLSYSKTGQGAVDSRFVNGGVASKVARIEATSTLTWPAFLNSFVWTLCFQSAVQACNLFAAGQDHLSIWKLLCMAHVSSSKNISLWMMRSTVSAGLDFPVTAPEARWPCLTEGVTGLRTPLLSTPEETYSKYEAVFEKVGPSLSLPSVNLFDQPECLHMGCVKPRTSSFVETRAWIRGSRIQREQTRVWEVQKGSEHSGKKPQTPIYPMQWLATRRPAVPWFF